MNLFSLYGRYKPFFKIGTEIKMNFRMKKVAERMCDALYPPQLEEGAWVGVEIYLIFAPGATVIQLPRHVSLCV